jgi:acetyl-CoA acetyltransferase family protein
MGRPVVVSAVRTPIGRARTGSLVDQTIYDLARVVVGEAVKRSGVDAHLIDDCILAEVIKGGGDTGRYTILDAGLPPEIPGVAVNRQCASGMTAVDLAAASIAAGMEKAVIAGGVESMTQTPVLLRKSPDRYGMPLQWVPRGHPEPGPGMTPMGILVGENTAEQYGISREEQDAWALQSNERAVAAIDGGRFADEIVPVNIARKGSDPVFFGTDEQPRRDTSAEKLASLRPAFKRDGTVTAGNACGTNDGAAALLLVDEQFASERNLEVLAVVRSWAAVGLEPERTGSGPIVAIPKAAARAGVKVGDFDLIEINEAFASMTVATVRQLELDPAKVNVNGGAVGLGHPIGASGARILVTLIHELRRRGGGLGVASLCAGGGMGAATVLDVLPA